MVLGKWAMDRFCVVGRDENFQQKFMPESQMNTSAEKHEKHGIRFI